MKSTDHLTELTLYDFLLFTVINLSKARDGAVSHGDLSSVQFVTSASTSQSLIGAVPLVSASHADLPVSTSNAGVISASPAVVPPFSASPAGVPPTSASPAVVPPFSASHASVPPFSASHATVPPVSDFLATVPAVSAPSAFNSRSIDSASHSSSSDVPATIAEAFRRYEIPSTARSYPVTLENMRYIFALRERKLDPTNVGESSRSSEPSGSPPWTIEYAPRASMIDSTPPPSRSTLKYWSSSVVAKCQSYFRRKKRPTAPTSITEDQVDKDKEKANDKDEDDDYVLVSRDENKRESY